MVTYQLTNKAEQELEAIYEYSLRHFGYETAYAYLSGFHDCFIMLAEYPTWGRDYGFIFPALQRYEYRSHSIYYTALEQGILIVRVLGNRQDPARHISDE